ncbi:MAG: DUF2075 domain-containing protein [Bacteroidetes bacterium]|nr:MAG: DUF2075 domain-containing protein [Bacteroidota bacterium]
MGKLSYFFKDSISSFLKKSANEVIGEITRANEYDVRFFQNKSWELQIPILKSSLNGYDGEIFFEFSIPRMGKRVDTILLIEGVLFVIEFKVGETKFLNMNIEQVWDYALDLKNFHEPSHIIPIIPILVATEAETSFINITTTTHNDNLILPVMAGKNDLKTAVENGLAFFNQNPSKLKEDFSAGRYAPTPTIIEAALSLYNNHSVEEITRNDSSAINLTKTTNAISDIIYKAREEKKKFICFVTGVPGAGKTLVGLKVATAHMDNQNGNASVYLSGNGPLVSILQEALARDRVKQEKESGQRLTKKAARQSVKAFIQNIHHYRDAYITDPNPPYDHVAIFDEAQRAWTKEQTASFMKSKKGIQNFNHSEPEFLISCLDRHPDWAVVICLVGGGQEINTGEAGISEWLSAVHNTFSNWDVIISPNLTDTEYVADDMIKKLKSSGKIKFHDDLHLAVSMRSFRAENVSLFVKQLLDMDKAGAANTYNKFKEKYPIVLTRDLNKAKQWIKEKARGSERYGIVVSSQAQRLKPLAIDVRYKIDPVNWFLEGKDDVRSSFFLEDAATEFQVQGLELDWACVTWDGDLRYSDDGWKYFAFKGNKWQNINSPDRRKYLLNAYRVLLTRARQGMIIVVPDGSSEDHTRKKEYYNSTFAYFKDIGIELL